MTLQIEAFILGPIANNTYLLWDDDRHNAVIIDPSFDPFPVIKKIQEENLALDGIWLTHGHFDHFIGIPDLLKASKKEIPVFLHQKDVDLYLTGGLGVDFGYDIPDFPKPGGFLIDGQSLSIAGNPIQVLYTPGHSAGHVAFYSVDSHVVFTGDLIFKQSVGRTDLPGADPEALLKSIYTRILTLPGDTLIFSGHGDATSVDEEVEYNPYLN